MFACFYSCKCVVYMAKSFKSQLCKNANDHRLYNGENDGKSFTTVPVLHY